jgi:signal transduction histidine kinase
MNPTPAPTARPSPWSRFANTCVTGFHAYANWLVGISWGRFFMLAIGLIISMAIIKDVPPFSFTYTEVVRQDTLPTPSPKAKEKIKEKIEKSLGKDGGIDISVDEKGVRIRTRPNAPTVPAAPAPPQPPEPPSSAAHPADPGAPVIPEVNISLPPGANNEEVRQAIEEARREVQSALEELRQETVDAAEEATGVWRPRLRTHRIGDPLMPLTMWFILLSMILKITYKGKVQAEAKAAQATEVAESESLKRQVVEARMAAMQAQVEPHFLFNTLASIDHLIETDPPRASIMQKNLIALLRASMPTMREANAQGTRDLGRELAVIRPYLEILKVRMEERLQTEVRVSDGLLSAEFPPMMLQSLVENAIKHGLEPKADGGSLTVSAEIVHGKLAVTVADTGLGYGKAATTGTGIGLSNIRERLALLYGNKASLTITETAGGGTTVTITVPYVAKAVDQPE